MTIRSCRDGDASDSPYLSDPCPFTRLPAVLLGGPSCCLPTILLGGGGIGHPANGGEGVVAVYLRRLLTSETLMATSHHKKTMRTTYRVGAGLAPAQNPGPMPNTAGATARVAPTNRIGRIYR
jgi:hypothetical protein